MRQKRHLSRVPILLGLLLASLLGGGAFLLLAEIPAPTHAIEKELDAKAFLPAKE